MLTGPGTPCEYNTDNERLFPGIEQDLAEGGAILGDMGLAMRWHHFGGYKKQYQSGLTGVVISRPFLEWHVHRCGPPTLNDWHYDEITN